MLPLDTVADGHLPCTPAATALGSTPPRAASTLLMSITGCTDSVSIAPKRCSRGLLDGSGASDVVIVAVKSAISDGVQSRRAGETVQPGGKQHTLAMALPVSSSSPVIVVAHTPDPLVEKPQTHKQQTGNPTTNTSVECPVCFDAGKKAGLIMMMI